MLAAPPPHPTYPSPNWLIQDILKFIENTPATTKTFRKNWKQAFVSYTEDQKKEGLLHAIEMIKTDRTLSLPQFQECFRTVEEIGLSPRVSNLNAHDYYARIVDKRNNHVHSLRGLACYLTSYYPNEQFFFAHNICLTSLNCLTSGEILKQKKRRDSSIYVEDVSFDHFVKLAETKPVFIIYQYRESFHKMLFVIQKVGDEYVLSFFDSLGINPWKMVAENDFFHYQMTSLVREFSERCKHSLKVYAVQTTRQKDPVNCGSFVVFDFELIFKFLNENIPLFEDSSTPNPAFLEISQADQDAEKIPSEYQRCKSKQEQNKMVNLKASLVALEILKFFLEKKVSYPQIDCQFEDQSEEDKEECVIF